MSGEEIQTATFTETVMVLREFAEALRGDWGSIDGRSLQLSLNELAEEMVQAVNEGSASKSVAELRDAFGMCTNGRGHWSEHCEFLCKERRT